MLTSPLSYHRRDGGHKPVVGIIIAIPNDRARRYRQQRTGLRRGQPFIADISASWKATMKRIGILQTGHTPVELADRFESYGVMVRDMVARSGKDFAYEIFPVIDGNFPQSPDSCDGWVITGSRFGAYDDIPWIRRLEGFIRDGFAQRVPMVGICFGHQIMAKALGGRVEKAAAGWGVGPHEYQLLEAPGWLDKAVIEINVMHQDQVLDAPADSRVIASSPFCPVAALAFGDNGLSFQGHPEFDNSYEHALIEGRRGSVVPGPVADAGLARLGPDGGRARDADNVSRWIGEFLEDAIRDRRAATV
ncbi:MAG: gamma-glutamyl-gamma-aminobutyrate hydrolase family protein [Geminicoccaceae bacterium]|nr:gamma-glutamyl-gamma-aminobutyrate hydrolase family protein [Geminicoccaceae bacterium]